jgi:hypothetical protein
MNVAVNTLFLAVVNHLVVCASGLLHGDRVRRKFIGEDYIYILRDILFDVLGERAGLGIFGMKEAEIAVPLANAYDNIFVVHATDSTLAAIFSADTGFVHFDSAVEHRFVGSSHCSTDSVAEIPCGFVSADSESALNLASGHSLFRFAQQEGCGKPLYERQVRVIENRSSGNRELVVAIFAVVQSFVSFQFDSIGIAAGATRAFGPAEPGKKLAALFVIGKHRVYVD